jgi:hypothetical protein
MNGRGGQTMMKTQIRDRVFETNSSSSHSVTIDGAELKDFGLDKDTIREGVIRVELPCDGYGWEWRRYYKPENKIAYLLLQLQGGCLPSDFDLPYDEDHSETFRENDSRTDYFLRTIEEATGCRVVVTRDAEDVGYGYSIDHDSVGKGLEHLGEADEILKLVFGRDSYIETGNDNENPPERIWSDDRGEVRYFEHILVERMPDGVPFTLRQNNGADWNKNFDLRTPVHGTLTTPDVTWAFRKKVKDLIAEGDVVIAGFHVSCPYHTGAADPQAAAFARRIAHDSNIDLFRDAKSVRLVRDFQVTFDIKPYVHEDGRVRSSPSVYDFMAQAEVTIMATATDDTVDRLVELVADAGSYAPKKEPLA